MRGTRTDAEPASPARGLWLALAVAAVLLIAAVARFRANDPALAPDADSGRVRSGQAADPAVQAPGSSAVAVPAQGPSPTRSATPTGAAANALPPTAASLAAPSGAPARAPIDAAPTATPPPPSAAATSRQVSLTLRGAPAGAVVKLGDQTLGEGTRADLASLRRSAAASQRRGARLRPEAHHRHARRAAHDHAAQRQGLASAKARAAVA